MARALGGHVLPVNYDAAGDHLVRLIRSERPAGVLMLGLNSSARLISLEKVAMNRDHSQSPRRDNPIIKGGRFVLFSRLPIDRLRRRLKRARIPSAVSYHAGTYVCNHVFYLGLRNTRRTCGFIHLPPVRHLSLRDQIRAVELLLEEMRSAA